MLNQRGTYKTDEGAKFIYSFRGRGSECHLHRISVPIKRRYQGIMRRGLSVFIKEAFETCSVISLIVIPAGLGVYRENLIEFLTSISFVNTQGNSFKLERGIGND